MKGGGKNHHETAKITKKWLTITLRSVLFGCIRLSFFDGFGPFSFNFSASFFFFFFLRHLIQHQQIIMKRTTTPTAIPIISGLFFAHTFPAKSEMKYIIYEYFFRLALNCFPAGNYMFKVNNRNTRKRCEICSKLTIKIRGVVLDIFIVNFERISHLVLVFLLLTLSW